MNKYKNPIEVVLCVVTGIYRHTNRAFGMVPYNDLVEVLYHNDALKIFKISS